MTPNPKDSQFIRHDVPKGASQNLKFLYEEYQKILELTMHGKYNGIKPENFVFEYSTYDKNAEILFSFIDRNNHSHKVTVSFYGDNVSTTCRFSYLFSADNFGENVISVQSFAECLMVQLWDLGIDANLCKCDWGLEFTTSMDSIAFNMDILVNIIVTSIKPMEWFYSKESVWKFYRIHYHLLQILPLIKKEAEFGRWKNVNADNFTVLRDKTQAYIALTYQEAGVFDMTFKVGFDENSFDPDVSGEWFSCEYDFNIRTQDDEIKDYYLSEQKEFCKTASVILDWTSYNSLFAYDENLTALTLLVSRKWAFQKYCLMLDIMIPLLFRHETTNPLVTKDMLEQKAKLESMLNTEMEFIEDKDDKYIFAKGNFLSEPEDPNTIYNEEMPF